MFAKNINIDKALIFLEMVAYLCLFWLNFGLVMQMFVFSGNNWLNLACENIVKHKHKHFGNVCANGSD